MESVDSFSYTPNTSALFYKNTSFCIFQVDLYFKYKFFVDKCSGKEGGIIITDQIKLHIHLDFFFLPHLQFQIPSYQTWLIDHTLKFNKNKKLGER